MDKQDIRFGGTVKDIFYSNCLDECPYGSGVGGAKYIIVFAHFLLLFQNNITSFITRSWSLFNVQKMLLFLKREDQRGPVIRYTLYKRFGG